MGQQQKHPRLGTDTFSGAGSLAGTRPLFFGKTLGQIELERSGLLKVASPISGHTLTVPDGSGPNHHAKIKDPICGTVLNLGNQACVVTPVLTQPQVYSRKFFLTKDIDIAIATLRATKTVSDKTNEKIGTSGTATGLDRALVTGGKLRCSQRAAIKPPMLHVSRLGSFFGPPGRYC